jgi:hypothetical protein
MVWRSSFSQRYRVGGENFVSKDLKEVEKFIIHAEGKPTDFGLAPQQDLWVRLGFRASNSLSVAFILALASLHPRNITNGASIDVEIALSHFNKKEFHHIFPRNYLKSNKVKGEHNAIANLCMLAASENKTISDNDPHEYIPSALPRLAPSRRMRYSRQTPCQNRQASIMRRLPMNRF